MTKKIILNFIKGLSILSLFIFFSSYTYSYNSIADIITKKQDLKIKDSNSIFFEFTNNNILDYKNTDHIYKISDKFYSTNYIQNTKNYQLLFTIYKKIEDINISNQYLPIQEKSNNNFYKIILNTKRLFLQTEYNNNKFNISSGFKQKIFGLNMELLFLNTQLFTNNMQISSKLNFPVQITDNSIKYKISYNHKSLKIGSILSFKRYNILNNLDTATSNNIFTKFNINSNYSINLFAAKSILNGILKIELSNENYKINGEAIKKNYKFLDINSNNNSITEIKSSFALKNLLLYASYCSIKLDSLNGNFFATPIIPISILSGDYYKFFNKSSYLKTKTLNASYKFPIKQNNIKLTIGINNIDIKSSVDYATKEYIAYPLPFFTYSNIYKKKLIDYNNNLLFLSIEPKFVYKKNSIIFFVSQYIPINEKSYPLSESSISSSNSKIDGARTTKIKFTHYF